MPASAPQYDIYASLMHEEYLTKLYRLQIKVLLISQTKALETVNINR